MRRSLKYIIIVNSVLLGLALLIIGLVSIYNYQNSLVESSQISASGRLVGGGIQGGFLYYTVFALVLLFFYVLPLFAAAMGCLYQLKNPNLFGLFKSLLIPLSYSVMTVIILSIFWGINFFTYGQGDNTVALFVLVQSGSALLLVILVNSTMLFIMKKMKKDSVTGVKEFIDDKKEKKQKDSKQVIKSQNKLTKSDNKNSKNNLNLFKKKSASNTELSKGFERKLARSGNKI